MILIPRIQLVFPLQIIGVGKAYGETGMEQVIDWCGRVREGLSFGQQSTVGKKVLMAISGILLIGFVVGHMLGNLKVYQGPEKINAYGDFLKHMGYPVFGHGQILWMLRLGLLAAVGVHFWSAVTLTLHNNKARPIGYRKLKSDASSYASRTMIWGGIILLLFIIFHILHLTTGHTHPGFVHGDVYANLVSGFQQWPVSAFYILAQLALGLHLYHGVWSMMRTLGAGDQRREVLRRLVALGVAGLVVVGNISIPIAVLCGFVR